MPLLGAVLYKCGPGFEVRPTDWGGKNRVSTIVRPCLFSHTPPPTTLLNDPTRTRFNTKTLINLILMMRLSWIFVLLNILCLSGYLLIWSMKITKIEKKIIKFFKSLLNYFIIFTKCQNFVTIDKENSKDVIHHKKNFKNYVQHWLLRIEYLISHFLKIKIWILNILMFLFHNPVWTYRFPIAVNTCR